MAGINILRMQIRSRIAKIRKDPKLQIRLAVGCFSVSFGIVLLYLLIAALSGGSPHVDRSILLFDTGSQEFFMGEPDDGGFPKAPSGQPAVQAVIFGNEQQPAPQAGAKGSELAAHGQFIGYFERLVDGQTEVCAPDGQWQWKPRASPEGLDVINHVVNPLVDKKPGTKPAAPAAPLRPVG